MEARRLPGMPESTLSYDVGGDEQLAPLLSASFGVSGKIICFKELSKGTQVHVSIVDADGQVVAAGEGHVRSVGFQEHRPANGPAHTERLHKIKLD
jgi:hypothetical protein